MNKRIRELAEQSGFFPVPDETEYDWEYRAENARYENFASLIVLECMNMSDELKSDYLKNRKNETDFDVREIYAEGEAACDTLKHRMKQHFGVK